MCILLNQTGSNSLRTVRITKLIHFLESISVQPIPAPFIRNQPTISRIDQPASDCMQHAD